MTNVPAQLTVAVARILTARRGRVGNVNGTPSTSPRAGGHAMRGFSSIVSTVAAVACTLLLPPFATAGRITIDQANVDFRPQLWQNAGHFAPFGQEFTPTLRGLNFVDLRGDSALGVGLVRIRHGSIEGPVVGISRPLDLRLPDLRFTFASRVRLVPGDLYVIDIVASEDSGLLIGSTTWNSYSGGRQVLWGEPVIGNDLWFQEGIIPEPPLGWLIMLGLGVVVFRRRMWRPS